MLRITSTNDDILGHLLKKDVLYHMLILIHLVGTVAITLIIKQYSALQLLWLTLSSNVVPSFQRSHFWWNMQTTTSVNVRLALNFLCTEQGIVPDVPAEQHAWHAPWLFSPCTLPEELSFFPRGGSVLPSPPQKKPESPHRLYPYACLVIDSGELFWKWNALPKKDASFVNRYGTQQGSEDYLKGSR